jgi:UDP-glucose 4-epimerase
MKIILVTGGAGFIGSHLCERLVQMGGSEVWSIDNYSTGSVANHIDGVNYLEGNVADISQIVNFKPDTIFHLGEYSRVEQSFEDIEKVWRYNKDGIFSIAQFSRRTGAKLIYAGSSTKYGDGGLGRNQSPYAWIKASNTEFIKNFGEWYDIPYAIVYFYNVYGKREISVGKYATLIALFMDKTIAKLPLTVVSPGTQKRNFTHIDDVIDGILLVGEKGYGDEYGIGSTESYSIIDIARMFKNEIVFVPERRGNRMTAEVITAKTEALGWQAKKSISDYIKNFIENTH